MRTEFVSKWVQFQGTKVPENDFGIILKAEDISKYCKDFRKHGSTIRQNIVLEKG
jgi:hypothetical protein